jgi:competence protein ComEC
VQEFIDYRTHPTGYTWNRDGVRFRILNSYPDGDDENTRSLSLSVSYKGFRMVHGGNTDTVSQGKILKRFPGEVPAQVFCASHHFQGSVDPGYIIETNPELVIVQAGEAIYASAAYMVEYKKEAEQVLNRHRTTPVETLLTSETGTVVVRVNDEHEWTYGCYMDQDDLTIPGL